MAESIVSGIALKLLNYLSQSAFEKIAPYFGGRQKLNELQMTMVMIRARLSDAERRQEAEEGEAIKLWLQRLKSMLYRLEDLFEEVVMADKQNEERHGGNFSKVVCFMPSLKLNKKVSKEAQFFLTELRSLKDNMERLKLREGNVANNQYALKRISGREETYSFVQEEEVYGRDEDKTMIVQMLLDSENVKEKFSVVAIVGMGGLGKTTLAKLAYDDKNVQQNFELKHWACIPDKMSSFKELAEKVLQAITGNNCHNLDMEGLQSKLRESVDAKKFLLVLDDVWDENHDRWHQFRSLLRGCKQGSKILVTSRSKVAVVNMGAVQPYELDVLSKDKSWELFKSIALREGQTETNPNFETIGKEIIKKCGDVPLAIKTIAGLLLSKDTEEEWVHFRDKEIAMIDQEGNNIMPTLKLSYNHLPPQLKQCFAYCSLFHEDYEFDIQRLILLWVAQGFVLSQENESPYDVGHTYFLHLLRRCFFQDVRRDLLGRMMGCKMHDLMHELAKMVGDECHLVDPPKIEIGHHTNNNIRHVHHLFNTNPLSRVQLQWLAFPQMQSLRSFITSRSLDETVHISCLRRLRALDLGQFTYKSLPDSIAELKHLRYLRARVKYLPKGITTLQKLETLYLRGSEELRELPSGFRKLTTLRHLLITHEWEFSEIPFIDMPPKFGELESLEILDTFMVGENNGLDVLTGLNLSGELKIFYNKHRQNAIAEAKRANLKKKLRLTLLVLDMSVYRDEGSVDEVDNLFECLQPPSTLKSLTIRMWNGIRLPSWGMDEFPRLLPNLVHIRIFECTRCQSLPLFSRQTHLKFLTLYSCYEVEYAEVRGGSSSSEAAASTSSSAPSVEAYFPCLEQLCLHSMFKLKGWLKIDQHCSEIDQQRKHSHQLQEQFFPRLSQLQIRYCPKLKSMPQVPTVGSLLNCYANPWDALRPLEDLELYGCEEMDLWDVKDDDDDGDGDGDVSNDKRINSSSTWQRLKSLHTLSLSFLLNLKSLPSDIGGLTSLKLLMIDWLPNLKTLPESIGNLSQLNQLFIKDCDKLEALPKSVRNVTTLQLVHINSCAQLGSRCKEPDGEDWPLIQHIPYVYIYERQETNSSGSMPAFCPLRCFRD